MGGVGFILATAIAQHTDPAIHDRAREITSTAMPSIEHLAALRTELLRCQMLAGDLVVAGEGRPAVAVQLAAARSTLDSEVRAYQALPRFAGEAEPRTQLIAQSSELGRALDLLEADPQQGRAAVFNVQVVHPAVDRLSETAHALIDLNAQAADQLANRIEAIRVGAEHAAFGLDTLCALF